MGSLGDRQNLLPFPSWTKPPASLLCHCYCTFNFTTTLHFTNWKPHTGHLKFCFMAKSSMVVESFYTALRPLYCRNRTESIKNLYVILRFLFTYWPNLHGAHSALFLLHVSFVEQGKKLVPYIGYQPSVKILVKVQHNEPIRFK